MFCGRCCVTEPRSRTALQLDIFIEIPSYSGRFRSFNSFGGYASARAVFLLIAASTDIYGRE